MNHHSNEYADFRPDSLTEILRRKLDELKSPYFEPHFADKLRQTLPGYLLNAACEQDRARQARMECEVIMGRLDMARLYGALGDVAHYERALIKSQEKCRVFAMLARESYTRYLNMRDWIARCSVSPLRRLLKGWSK